MSVEKNLAQLTLDTISLPVIVIDREFRLVSCNEMLHRWKAEFKWPVEIVPGRSMFEIFKFLPQRVIDNYKLVLASGEPLRSESTYEFSGRSVTVEVELLPMVVEGEVEYIATLLRNVTVEREMKRALQQSEERFRLQFLAIPVPTFTWEQQGDDFVLIGFNQSADEFTHGAASTLIGQHASRLYGPDSVIVKDLWQCLTTQALQVREQLYELKTSREQKYVRAYCVFIPPNQVQVHGIDLTDHKQAKEELKAAHDELERRISERTQELKEANDQLTIERETLERKNKLLHELLEEIGESRRMAALQIQANIDRVVLPLLEHMKGKVDSRCTEYMGLIRSSLAEITSPLVTRLEQKFRHLTPQEIQICSLIRRGYSSKEIAGVRNSSVQTVLKQRTVIRRKLGLKGQDANLATFLTSVSVETSTDKKDDQ